MGKYVVSSHRGGTNAKFDGSKRVTKFDECAKVGMSKPGPGYYRAGSEFGQYDGEVYATINYKSKTSLLKWMIYFIYNVILNWLEMAKHHEE